MRPEAFSQVPCSLPESKDYELEFTLLSSTEYTIVETIGGAPWYGTGEFPLIEWPYAYIGCTLWGLMIWDISDLHNPLMLSHTNGHSTDPDLYYGLGDFDIYQDTLLVGTYVRRGGESSGLIIVNVADPHNPFLLTTYEMDGHFDQTLVDGDFAYQCYYESDGSSREGLNGLVVFEITVPDFPIFCDSIRTPGLQTISFWKGGGYAYLFNSTDSPEGYLTGVEIHDINGRLVYYWDGEDERAIHSSNHQTIQTEFTWQPEALVPSGIYLVKVTAGDHSACEKVLYLK
ncbi:hypothetical protein JXI42_09660 [bacterium]|nr:hypothetical protein [bacterium]